jgi:transcriptional regulator with PAS, ATPase and Fis domain
VESIFAIPRRDGILLWSQQDRFVNQTRTGLHNLAVTALPDRSPFVGRDAEFGDATELLRRVAGGQSGVLAIMGEAGVGKSRFTSELRRTWSASWRRICGASAY